MENSRKMWILYEDINLPRFVYLWYHHWLNNCLFNSVNKPAIYLSKVWLYKMFICYRIASCVIEDKYTTYDEQCIQRRHYLKVFMYDVNFCNVNHWESQLEKMNIYLNKNILETVYLAYNLSITSLNGSFYGKIII